MAVQTSYSENMRAGVAGQLAESIPATLISRTVETSGGLAFGVPVAQGTADRGVRLFTTGDTAADFVGITVRDRSVNAGTDRYALYDDARLMTKGSIWVTASVAVAAGDPVYIVPATAAFTNVATSNVLVAGARWDTSTSTTGQIAIIRI